MNYDILFNNLKSAEYTYIDNELNLPSGIQFGVMAQDIKEGLELQGKIPEDYSIIKMNDNGFYSVDYLQLIPLLITKVQELEKEIKTMKGES